MRALLSALGLTYQQAADLLNCSKRTIDNYVSPDGFECSFPVLFTLVASRTHEISAAHFHISAHNWRAQLLPLLTAKESAA